MTEMQTGEFEKLRTIDRTGARGLVFVGTEPGCGKTMVMTGLCAVLQDYDLPIRVIKPLGVGTHKKDTAEMTFMSIVGKTAVDYPLLTLRYPPIVLETEWKELILTSTRSDIFTFIELPCTAATPIRFEQDRDVSAALGGSSSSSAGGRAYTHRWMTITDLLKDLELPVVLVASHSIDVLEKIEFSISYLQTRDIEVTSIVTVETNKIMGQALDERLFAHDFELMLSTRYGLPYLGKLAFSPVVSVPKVRQGNLKKTIEQDLDLLAFRKLIELPVN